MELNIKPRVAKNKGDNKGIRREGNIPAVIYSEGKEGTTVTLQKAEFQKAVAQLKTTGTLSTTVFSLKNEKKTTKAIIKEIQYNPVTYDVIHLDFIAVSDSVPVRLNVPIQCTGVADCIGVKLGGNLRQLMRTVKVRCLPKDIPSHFEVDIRDMDVGHEKRLADIAMPKGVHPLIDKKSLAVVISK